MGQGMDGSRNHQKTGGSGFRQSTVGRQLGKMWGYQTSRKMVCPQSLLSPRPCPFFAFRQATDSLCLSPTRFARKVLDILAKYFTELPGSAALSYSLKIEEVEGGTEVEESATYSLEFAIDKVEKIEQVEEMEGGGEVKGGEEVAINDKVEMEGDAEVPAGDEEGGKAAKQTTALYAIYHFAIQGINASSVPEERLEALQKCFEKNSDSYQKEFRLWIGSGSLYIMLQCPKLDHRT